MGSIARANRSRSATGLSFTRSGGVGNVAVTASKGTAAAPKAAAATRTTRGTKRCPNAEDAPKAGTGAPAPAPAPRAAKRPRAADEPEPPREAEAEQGRPSGPSVVPAPAPLVRPALEDLRTLVVNLERRPDRLEGCGQRLRAACPRLSWSRFPATDGKVTRIPLEEVVSSWSTARNCVYQRLRSIRKGWDDLDNYKELRLPLSAGERGCASSHVRAWRACLEIAEAAGRDVPVLVLEDDAAPTESFEEVLPRALAAVPEETHLLYLGYSQAADWRREVSPEVVEAEYVWTTVAYVLWPAGARMLLSRLPIDQPVDNWMGGLNGSGDLKAFCARPKIVRQAEPWNVNSDVAHSDEHYWGPTGDSDIAHSDAFYWGPLPPAPALGQANDRGGDGTASGALTSSSQVQGSALHEAPLANGSLWEAGSEASSDDDADGLEDLSVNRG